ncbi:MAG TPA: T9SS type A sorting domain-containing protein [Bacteroidia bacterium]|nr:T9SS type A sorting domain-containing protein [Bacteroidia bacterium]
MAIFETITSSANVNYHNSNLYGDITYKAGKQIHLTSGFKVQKGAKFHALIEPVMCDANGQYRAASNSVVWDNAGNDNPVPMNSKINYTATKKEIKPQKKRPNSLKNSMANFSDLLIYPNPTDGEVQVSLASKETLNEIELIDLVGNKVMTLNVSSNEVTLNLKGLEKGCYLIKCKANLNKVYYKKIVLN